MAEQLTHDPATEVVGDGGSASGTARTRFRRFAPWLALGLLLVLVVVLGFFGRSGQDGTALSPVNPAPAGAMALAEVLSDRGVDVVQAESLEAAEASVTEGATLLLHDPDSWLSADQLSQLSGIADRLVLVEPTTIMLSELAPTIRQAGLIPAAEADVALPAACQVTDATAAGAITAGGFAYRGDLICFPPTSAQGGPPSGSYAATAAQDVVALGNGAILSNESIDREGNAALALRTLGATPVLVWYQPTPADLAPTDALVDPLNLLPGWVNPVMLWLLATALLAVLWRGRRLGPLVAEPLPVVVRAAETAEGRARLYQDSSSLDRAAANLRAATLLRLALRLRLPATSSVTEVVDAAARHSDRSPADLDKLLRTDAPASDAHLVRWSQDLDSLEKEIDAR
ncbi:MULTISPECIES: DUF4350 domain-containing protein [unclassified Arthrobacter]|uniref:DUF4350 domain-containing protein n=1 Tax=unclassified Arthrobacter TaxID=235627 RepID=UPI001490E09F|nr:MULTISPECIES: DUF4350 domain-containing protein [unclassified Arthrobacter]MBE0008695.1 DUF4350 domain-containing protein [Arthrobacter sp. AET 35A]NOJ62528.1 DUF4350 domain-containing protein [Arthrobacter sp. 147(2020)]